MFFPKSRIQSLFIALACLTLAISLTGCGGPDFGSELAVRPSPTNLGSDSAVLHLPQDQAYTITLAPTQKTPGLEGKAFADAKAFKTGAAEAVASVENGGSAQAGFQLGHSLKNDTDRMVYLKVHVSCDYHTDAAATPSGPNPDAQVGLTLYARDGRNRLLRSYCLAKQATDTGAATSQNRKILDFSMPLGAREWVNIYVAGRARIDVAEGHAANGSIKINQLEMTIEQEAAPPVAPAADE